MGWEMEYMGRGKILRSECQIRIARGVLKIRGYGRQVNVAVWLLDMDL
jgi:hypothetical protein